MRLFFLGLQLQNVRIKFLFSMQYSYLSSLKVASDKFL